MLILTRSQGEALRIGDEIALHVVAVQDASIRLGIAAPVEVRVLRAELATTDNASPASAAPRTYRPPRRARLHRRRRPDTPL